MSTTVKYKGQTLTTVSNETKTLTTSGKWLEDNIELTDVSQSSTLGTKTITSNGTYNASSDSLDGYSQVTVNVPTQSPSLQNKSVSYTPTESTQTDTVSADSGYDGLDTVNVTVNPIPSEYIVPSGDITITENGTIDVRNYENAIVNVSGGGISYDDIASETIPTGDIILNVSSIANYAFAYKQLNAFTVKAENATYIGQNAFRECSGLTQCMLPNLTSFHATAYIFFGDIRLETVDWGKANVPGNCFYNNRALTTLILRKSTVATLATINTFTNTPFRGYGGTYSGHVYVPQALIEDYKTATNWVTLYESYNDLFQPIEGSAYEI